MNVFVKALVAASLLLAFGQPGAAPTGSLQLGFFNVDSDDASRRPIARHVARYPEVALWAFTQVWDARWEKELVKRFAEARGTEAASVLGTSGGNNRSLLLWDTRQMSLVASSELAVLDPRPGAAAPLLGHFRLAGGEEFLVVTVHLDRANAKHRETAAADLERWAAGQDLPVVVGGTFNFDLPPAESAGAAALALLTGGGALQAVALEAPMATACPPYDAVQDLVFVGGAATGWGPRAWVLSPENSYCPDTELTSSHRPLALALLPPAAPAAAPVAPALPAAPAPAVTPGSTAQPDAEQVLRKIEAMEAEIQELKEQLRKQQETSGQ